MNDDLISRQAVTDTTICDGISCNECSFFNTCEDGQLGCLLKERVDKLPPINPQEPKWIPLKTRPMTDEESTYYRDWAEYDAEIFDCPLPDDGQEVLVSYGGYVCVDTFCIDDGCYFEGVDIDDVEAWMPLPKPYDSQESDNEWNRVTMIDVNGNTHKVTFQKEDMGDYPDEIPNQFDNLTGSMNL